MAGSRLSDQAEARATPPSQVSKADSTVPPPVAKEAPPASWHTTSSAESSTTKEASTSVSRAPPSVKGSAPSGSFHPAMPSGVAGFHGSAPSVGSSSRASGSATSDHPPEHKRQRDASYHSSWQSGSQTEHDRQKAAAAAGCPASVQNGSTARAGTSADDEDDEAEREAQNEQMMLEGCSFARKKALSMRRQQERRQQLGIFADDAQDGEGTGGVSTPIAGADAGADDEDDNPLNAVGAAASSAALDDDDEMLPPSQEQKPASGSSSSRHARHRSHDATAGFGSQGLGGLSIREGSGSDAGGRQIRQGSDTPRAGSSKSNGRTSGMDGDDDDDLALFGGTAMQQSRSMPGRSSTSLASERDKITSLQLTPEQEARARQQIRADLAGVDRRALKGPLRDLMQNPNYSGAIPGSLWSSDASDPPLASSASDGGELAAAQRPRMGPRRRSSSLGDTSASGSAGQFSREKGKGPAQPAQKSTDAAVMPPPPQPSAGKQADGKKGALARISPQRPGNMRRDRSGLTVSPQEAFLDYDNVEAAIARSGTAKDRSISVFAADPPGMDKAIAGDGLKGQPVPFRMSSKPTVAVEGSASTRTAGPAAATVGRVKAGGNVHVDSPSDAARASSERETMTHEDTPSLTGSSSVSSRESVASPATSAAALSNVGLDRIRAETGNGKGGNATDPEDQPLAAVSAGPNAPGKLMHSNSSASFLNAYPSTTSTPDDEDEDEKPFPARGEGSSAYPFPSQRGSQFGAKGSKHFSHPSATSSEEEDKQASSFTAKMLSGNGSSSALLAPPGRRPLAGRRTPGSFGGYGYMPGSAESGLSLTSGQAASDEGSDNEHEHHRPMALHGFLEPVEPKKKRKSLSRSHSGESQSNEDDGTISPSIRSSAQAIRSYKASPPVAPRTGKREPKSKSATPSDGTEADELEDDDDDDDEYGAPKKAGTKRRRGGKGNAPSTSSRQSKPSTTTTSGPVGGSTTTLLSGAERTFPINKSGMSICDYVSPLTGDYCGTEFHRLYDLTRHRETIHAKDEAKAIREKKLTLEQCIVLGKEVDPKTSSATVEWKCEGRNGCGSVFSRKDALLRHKRIRNH